MTNKEFNIIVNDTLNECKKLLCDKSKEYDFGEDRLHSFKVAAELQGISNIEALRGYLTKHIVSIFDMMKTPDNFSSNKWDEKILDVINYMLLLKALLLDGTKEMLDVEKGDLCE